MESADIVGSLIFCLFFYTLFSILYVAVQKWSKKEIRLKTIRNGGTITTILAIIIISSSEGSPGGELGTFFIFWGLAIIGLIKLFEDEGISGIELGEGEEIIKDGRGLYTANPLKNYSGRLYLTDRRIFFHGKYGSPLMPTKKRIVFDIQTDQVMKVSSGRSLVYSGGLRILDIETKSDRARVTYILGIDDWVRVINNTVSKRPQKPPVVEAPPEVPSKPLKTPKKCPSCGGNFSAVNFYKLKAGNDVTCEYCEELIES